MPDDLTDHLFDPGPPAPGYLPDGTPISDSVACVVCQTVGPCLWVLGAQQWACAHCLALQGSTERLATPDEVDAGCELGIAFDPIGGYPPNHPQRSPECP